MAYTITSSGFVPQFGLEGDAEILQNVNCIINSRLGSMPMSRNIGLSQEWMGLPANVAQVMILSELAEEIQAQEPRAQVETIEYAADGDSGGNFQISAKVVISDGE